MRRIIFLLSVLSFLFSASSEKTFKIDGMTCGGCSNKVQKALDELDGIESCSVNVDKGQALIVFNDEIVNEKQILSALTDKTDFSCSIPQKKVRKGFFQRLFGW